jgi:competence protein ComEA
MVAVVRLHVPTRMSQGDPAMDRKSITETAADAAKVAVGIAAIAVDALMGTDQSAEGNPNAQGDAGRSQSGEAEAPDQQPKTAADQEKPQMIDINKAKFDELVSLRHIGRGRAKRIMASRPFRSVDDLASRGIVPEDVLAEVRSRLAV